MTPASPRLAALRGGLALVAGAGLAAGLGEAARTAPAAPDLGWQLAFAGVAWGLWTLLALALASPALLGGLGAWRPAAAGGTPARPGFFPWLLGHGVALAAALPLALGLADRLGETIAPDLRTPLIVAATLAIGGLLAPIAPAIASLAAAWPARWRVPPRALAVGAALVGVGLVFALRGVDPRLTPLGLGVLGAALAVLAGARVRRVLPWVALAALLAAGGCLIALAGALPATIRGATEQGLLTGLAFEHLEAWSDDDGDGFGDAFGGLDCDDRDPFINPAALDEPGNGVDENCRGGDAPRDLRRPRLPSPEKRLTTYLGDEPPHIVLLVLDAVRADALDGSDPTLAPNLHRWMARGTRFTRAFSTSSSTRHAVPALLTGRWTGHTGYHEKVSLYYVDDETHTLAEALAEKSYRTAAVMPPFVHGRLLGMGRGFRQYVPFGDRASLKAAAGRNAPLAVARALEVLAEPYPFATFLYVHLDDAHAPYSKTDATREDDGTPRTRYLNEINRMDGDLAPLLAHLEELQKERPVVLAITADHGEAFGEHGSFTHGRDLYQAVMHVPMFLVGPGIPAGGTIDEPVDLLDLGVTLAQAGGARLRDAEGDGLWGLLTGRPGPDKPRPLFAEMRILHPPYPTWAAVVEWPYKLIRRQDTGQQHLFDLATDPDELRDLAAERTEDAARLAGLLLRWSELGTGPGGRFEPPTARP
ncbi:MAG: sulfatase-like hydrolase/transferase [Myxococcales bacterium]|nr:sulfatase-like hydrolase/transferase [Myxococcales bacterium]